MEPLFDAFRTREALEARIASIAAAQHGVISRKQAIAAGASRHRIRLRLETGRWREIDRGVFIIGGAPIRWRSRLLALCLAFGEDTTISHLPAGALWRLPGFESEPEPEAIVARNRSKRYRRHRVHWVGPIPAADRGVVDRIPVTTPSRTLLDCAGRVPQETLELAVDDALRRKLTSVPRLRWQLANGGRRLGISQLRALLDARDPNTKPAESVLETKVARILRKAKLPGLVTQHEIVVAGRLIARVDFAFPAAKVAVEADGYRWHSGRAQWQQDLGRRNALTNLGWRVIHVTWEGLKRPQAIVDQVEQALRARLF